MTQATARRALLAGVPVLAALLTVAVVQAASAPTSVAGFERGVGILAAAGLAVVAVLVRPAWTISAAIILSAFSSHWSLLGSPLPLDRVALVLGIGSVLFREARHRDGRLTTRPIDWLLMVIALYAVLSLVLEGTLHSSSARFTLLDRFGLLPFATFFVAPFAFRTPAERRILLGSLVALGAYLGFTAVFERTGLRALVVPGYINDPSVGIHFDRARGPFLESNADGVAIYIGAVAAAVAFTQWKSTRWRAFALVIVGVCALGLFLTLTRAVWLGALVASPLALLAGRETRRYLIPVALAGFVLVIGALALIPGMQEKVQKRADDQQPLYDRRNGNAAAIRMIDARPLFGFGWGQFRAESAGYYKQAPDYPLSLIPDLHNVYLSNAVELGLVGGGLWLVAVLIAVGGGVLRRGPPDLRAWKIGLVGIALCVGIAMATAPSAFVLPTLVLWTWSGVAWGRDDPELSAAAA